MSELLPCPFCGGEAETRTSTWNDKNYKWTVQCNTNGCMGEVGCAFYRTEAEAIEAWNNRTVCKNCAALNRAAGLWAKADKRARDLERTCRMSPSDYYPCAEDGCMRLKVRMWTCSECEADHVGSKPNYCPNCGRKVVS